ncbi:MAG: hypothetical protein WB711_03185 [Terriglobales bacterium]
MRTLGHRLIREVAGWFMLLSLVPFATAQAQGVGASQSANTISGQNQSNNSGSGVASGNDRPSQPVNLPDSPGSVRLQALAENLQSDGQQASQKAQANGTQQPVGTAAAESVETTGVAASNPAGAAIAPAKQRRTRAILIKVGVLVGAGVAIGTVAALSSGSPSRPPGAR